MRRCDGYILVVVLIFMQILMLLSWCSIENVLLANKFSKNLASYHALHREAEKILDDVESSLLVSLPSCIIPITEASELLQKSLDWWQSSETCSGNFQQFEYYYVLEPLVTDPCAVIADMGKIADYFRITLLLASHKTTIGLQSTIVLPHENNVFQKCEHIRHVVQAGRQTWNDL